MQENRILHLLGSSVLPHGKLKHTAQSGVCGQQSQSGVNGDGGHTMEGLAKLLCSAIGLMIAQNNLFPNISADTQFLALAIILCGYIAYSE